MGFKPKHIGLIVYILFLLIPIYWLLNMSLKTNQEILSTFSLWPEDLTFANYEKIFSDPAWYWGYINSIAYVTLNTIISLCVALPAAYAFSRYSFMGDKHLFFWLLTNRMAPPAAFLLPFFSLYQAVGLFDTYWAVAIAHCLFNVPLAVWILEGFMSGIPKEIDETAYIDGYSFPKFFFTIFIPLIKAGIGVTAFFCFMFSWVELLLARTLTSSDATPIAVVMTSTVGASGGDWGVLAAAGILTIIPGALVIWFVRKNVAKGFALGRSDLDAVDRHHRSVLQLRGADAHRDDHRPVCLPHPGATGLPAPGHHPGRPAVYRPVDQWLYPPDLVGTVPGLLASVDCHHHQLYLGGISHRQGLIEAFPLKTAVKRRARHPQPRTGRAAASFHRRPHAGDKTGTATQKGPSSLQPLNPLRRNSWRTYRYIRAGTDRC